MPASITLTVSHLPTSTSFFLSALQPLSYVYRGRVNDTIGFGLPDAAPDFWITQSIPGVPPGPAHVAFPATSRGVVHEFFHAALKAGAKVHGEPALRDDCGYYSAAVIDFDGNSIEAVFRPDLLALNAEDSKSVASMTKSVTRSKAPTTVSSAMKAKSTAPSKAPSTAPPPARSTVSKAPSAAPSATPSKAPTASVHSEAPARTTISRAPTAPAAPQGAGNSFSDMMAEARGTVNFAREMVNSVRQSTSPPQGTAQPTTSSSPDSHGPSDAIVGTLLGVAAGAALHYAFSNRGDKPSTNTPTVSASAPVTPPGRSTVEETYYYYPNRQGYTIEPAGSEYSRASGTRHSGQRLIEMVDNDPSVASLLRRSGNGTSKAGSAANTARPRRRSSFSGTTTTKQSAKLLEGPPPTSYRGPSIVSRSPSASKSTASGATRPRSSSTSRSQTSHHSEKSRHSSTHSTHSHASSGTRTVVTAIKSPSSTASKDTKNSTVIGRLTEKQLSKLEAGGRLEKGNTDVTRSVIGKVKAVDRLDVSGRELRPDDSISQVSSVRSSGRRR